MRSGQIVDFRQTVPGAVAPAPAPRREKWMQMRRPPSRLPKPGPVIAAAAAAAGAWLPAFPDIPGFAPQAVRCAGIGAIFLGLWATRTLPDHLAAMLFFLLAIIGLDQPRDVIFAGFRADAVWLILGGVVLGSALQTTALAQRLARIALARASLSYAAVLFSMVGAGLMFVMVVPSMMARLLVLIPIALALAERMGFEEGSPGRHGIAMAAILGTVAPGYTVLPSGIPNVAMLGGAQALYGVDFTYGSYWLANFPVLATMAVLLLPLVILLLCPAARPAGPAPAALAPISRDERVVALVLCGALALWVTDFIHHIPPAWVAIGAAILCLAPGFGPVRKVPFAEIGNFGVWLLAAAIISLGSVINGTGLGSELGALLASWLDLTPDQPVRNFMALYVIGLGVSIVSTTIGAPTVMTPIAGQLADATGWPIDGVLLAQVPTWIFTPLIYQTPAILIGMTIAKVPVWTGMRVMAMLAGLGVLIVLPLQFLWLRALGVLP